MKIRYKDTSHTPETMSLKKSATIAAPIDKNLNQERPLKHDSQNLSFKGLSLLYRQVNKVPYKSNEILNIAKMHLGESVDTLYNTIKKSPRAKRMVNINDKGEVTFHKKTVLNLIYDGIIYPIKILPGDLLNGAVNLLKKIKPLKNWAEKLYEKPILKNARQRSKIDAQVNSLRGVFEKVTEFKDKPDEISSKLFQQSVKMFDPKTGNYDTKHERSLTRIVSGVVPAFFLANDAYNLSSMYKDDSKEAQKEKKTRFKQELSRVFSNAYITLITLGALQKYINNSKVGIMLTTGLTVLVTEMFSRLSNGKHIDRISPEKAKEINKKDKLKKGTDAKNEDGKSEDYNLVLFKSEGKSFSKVSSGKNSYFKGFSEQAKTEAEKKQEPLLSFNTIMKACGVIIAAGFGIKGLKNIKVTNKATNKVHKPIAEFADKLAKPFNDLYKKVTVNPNHTISESDFNTIIAKLDDAGFGTLANKYKEIAKDITKNGVVSLGKKDKKIRPVVDFVIAPFKFIYNAITLPYRLVDKGVQMFAKKAPPKAKDVKQLNIEALSKSIENIGREALKGKNFDKAKFNSFVSDNIMKSFNLESMSNVSNSELSNLAKTAATAATIWFLMADNYNMVMLKSNGDDQSGAKLKAKERFVQETSRLFYQTLLIDLFNNTFRTQYNKSLWGASWITAINTYISENLNRKSIGMPVKPHSKAELIEIERRKDNSTGFLKNYYNFMAKLTGKKTLAEQRKQKELQNK